MAPVFFPRLKEIGVPVLLPEERAIDAEVVTRTLLPTIGIFYLEDAGDLYHYVSRSRLKELGLTQRQLHDLALANLRRHALTHAQVSASDNGITSIVGMGEMESNLCLVPDTIQRFGFIPSQSVFSIPTREIFVFCGRKNQSAIRLMKSIAQSVFNEEAQSKRISTQLLQASETGEPLRFAGEFSNPFASLASTLFGRV